MTETGDEQLAARYFDEVIAPDYPGVPAATMKAIRDRYIRDATANPIAVEQLYARYRGHRPPGWRCLQIAPAGARCVRERLGRLAHKPPVLRARLEGLCG